MRFQQFQVSSDPCRVLSALMWVAVRLRIEALAQVSVTDTLDQEFAAHHGTEDATVFWAYRTQSPKLSALAFDSVTYFIQQLMRRGWFTYHGERLQIALISSARDRHAPADIGNAFTQGQPFHDYQACFICLPTAHLKALRVIDGGFGSQHAAGFVIHFDRVLLDPVPDSQTFDPSLQASAYFAIMAAIGPSAQKSEHILTVKLLDGMVDQGGINISECLWVSEQNVSGVFSLADGPVIRSQHDLALRIEPGINFARQSVQKAAPVLGNQLVTQLLRTLKISNPGKAVALLLIADAGPGHLLRQILSAVEANLDGHWQPGLQPHMHQPKLSVGKIKVEMKTFALTCDQVQTLALRLPTNPKRTTGFQTREHTNQSLSNPISFHDLSCSLFLRLSGKGQIDERALRRSRELLSVLLHPIRDLLYKGLEVFVKNSLTRQKPVHPAGMTDRTQVTAEQNPVKTCYSAEDAALVPFQKALHDAPPVEFSQTQIIRHQRHGALTFWLRLKAAPYLRGKDLF